MKLRSPSSDDHSDSLTPNTDASLHYKSTPSNLSCSRPQLFPEPNFTSSSFGEVGNSSCLRCSRGLVRERVSIDSSSSGGADNRNRRTYHESLVLSIIVIDQEPYVVGATSLQAQERLMRPTGRKLY